jgi:hypothetical protein
MSKVFLLRAAERVLWTAAQAGLATLSVDQFHLPTVYILPIASGLAALKALVARHVGDPDSPATLPKGV